MIRHVFGWKTLVLAVCCAVCCAAQDLRIAFRYDPGHVLFYAGKMQDPATFSPSELKQRQIKQPPVDYGAGGYLLPLSAERLQTLRPIVEEEAVGEVPALGNTITVLLGGRAKVQATVEKYVEQYGTANPVVWVGILARIVPGEEKRFRKVTPSAFLIAARPKAPLPMTTSAGPCPTCQKKVLNWFPGLGELILEQAEKGCWVTLYRVTPNGLKPTALTYGNRE